MASIGAWYFCFNRFGDENVFSKEEYIPEHVRFGKFVDNTLRIDSQHARREDIISELKDEPEFHCWSGWY
jgi:hypothetical protein